MAAPLWVKHMTLTIGKTYAPGDPKYRLRQAMIASVKAAPPPCGCWGHDAPYLCAECRAKVEGA